MSTTPPKNWASITSARLSLDVLTDWATRPECGPDLTLSGIVRNGSSTHDDVQALEYETNEELAERRLDEIIDEARRRWPTLAAEEIHYRTGRVELSETTVVIVVSPPHRAEAFDDASVLHGTDADDSSIDLWLSSHHARACVV